MQIALIGLGRMGQNMARRLLKDGHRLVLFDNSKAARDQAQKWGGQAASSLRELKDLLPSPRIAWVMVPHGQAVNSVLFELGEIFEPGDIVIDGGNSHFIDSIEHQKELSKKGIDFLDVGVSGGIFGLERGYCLMVGGKKELFTKLEPIFRSLAPGLDDATLGERQGKEHSSATMGYLHCGNSGSGHYVKMIHNAIEYGMMQAYAEGLGLLHNADCDALPDDHRFSLDIEQICEVWRNGSVISSWLLDLLARALKKDPDLNDFKGHVPDSGEGRWALMEAIKQGSEANVLAASLFTRFRSRKESPFSERSLSALRKEFGGHEETQPGKNKT